MCWFLVNEETVKMNYSENTPKDPQKSQTITFKSPGLFVKFYLSVLSPWIKFAMASVKPSKRHLPQTDARFLLHYSCVRAVNQCPWSWYIRATTLSPPSLDESVIFILLPVCTGVVNPAQWSEMKYKAGERGGYCPLINPHFREHKHVKNTASPVHRVCPSVSPSLCLCPVVSFPFVDFCCFPISWSSFHFISAYLSKLAVFKSHQINSKLAFPSAVCKQTSSLGWGNVLYCAGSYKTLLAAPFVHTERRRDNVWPTFTSTSWFWEAMSFLA